MDLFEECIEVLSTHARICDQSLDTAIRRAFDKNFKLEWSRINWEFLKEKYAVESVEEIVPTLQKNNKNILQPIYIIGNNARLPVIESNLEKVLEFFYDVVAVSPITWFFCPSEGWVIQIDDDDTITIGFAN